MKKMTLLAFLLLAEFCPAGEQNGARGNFVTLENTLGFVESPDSFVPGPTNAELVLSADDCLIWETRGKPKPFVRPPVPYRYYLQKQINQPATLIFEGVYLQGFEPRLIAVSTNGSILHLVNGSRRIIDHGFQVGMTHHYSARVSPQDIEFLGTQTNNLPISFFSVTTNRTFTDDSIPGTVIGVSANGSLLNLVCGTTTNTCSLPDIPSNHYFRVHLNHRNMQGIQEGTNSLSILLKSSIVQDWQLTFAYSGGEQLTIKTPKEPDRSVRVFVPRQITQHNMEAIRETGGSYNHGFFIRRQTPVVHIDDHGLTIWNGERFTNALWTVEKPTKP